jgi:undecaprenyl-diphosphatase
MDWQALIDLDKQLLLWFNGSQSLYLDSLVRTLTNALTWIPLYVGLLYMVIRSNPTVRDVVLILAAAGCCVLLAGAVDDGLVKPTVARWRPTHDPEIGSLVDVVNNYRGGNYGFFSAHAANTFSIAVFFSLLVRQRLLTIFLVCWSLINCYTRLYLGVHYPGDILVGLCWGGFVGWLVYQVYCRITIPVKYPLRHCYIPMAILILTVIFALIKAAITDI